MLILAQPSSGVRKRMLAAVREHGLDARMQGLMFPDHNWHQTFCGPYDGSEVVQAALQHAGDTLVSSKLPSFTLSLNRIRGESGMLGIHWSFFARGRPKPFDDVLKVLKDEVTHRGLTPDAGHRPHVTICYKAPEPLKTRPIAPIHWHISELLLAERTGTGNEWSYRPLHRWILPSPPDDDLLI